MKKINWYVGQKVSDQRFGNGEIIDIDLKDGEYPISVKFNDVNHIYTLTGKFDIFDKHPSLSQESHVPLEYEYVDDIKIGDIVYAKNGNVYTYGKVKEILPNNMYSIVNVINEKGEESSFISDDVKSLKD